jgi:uncharacterized protein DUF5995
MASYERELAAARQTLHRAVATSEMFCRNLGALAPIMVPPFGAHFGRRPGTIASVLDHKYWFAKLYELMTLYEIQERARFACPGYVMHFIPVFHGLYNNALQAFLAGNTGPVSTLWTRHFNGPGPGEAAAGIEALQFSVVTGVTAHIQGDMATALEQSYRTYAADPKPPFDDLHADFFVTNRPIFDLAKAAFFLDVAQKAPFPFRPDLSQYIIGVGDRTGAAGLDINEVYRWRETAWTTARGRIPR